MAIPERRKAFLPEGIDLDGLDLTHITWRRDKWWVRVPINGSVVYLGSFPTEDIAQAIQVRDDALTGVVRTVERGNWRSSGVMAETPPNEDDVLERALKEWNRTVRKESARNHQTIEFDDPVIALVFLGDQHFIDPGVDINRAFEEAEIVSQTEGMFPVLMGDLVNQMVIGKLRAARDGVRMSIPDEWVLLRMYLRLLVPKLTMTVGGNHDFWASLLTGVDWFHETLSQLAPDSIYDADDARVVCRVGGWETKGRIRHKWRGSSIHNPTHGIERAAKFDQDFDWGVGAHTHQAGVSRQFSVGGKECMAIQVGAYKRFDSYAKKLGLQQANPSCGVALILDAQSESMIGVNNLELAARIITGLRKDYGL